MGKRIAFTTLGSLGDVNPMLGLALELKRRGHDVSLSTSKYFQPHIEKYGIRFHEVVPNLDPNNKHIIHTVLDPARGPERFHREILFPHIEASYRTFLEEASSADLIVSGILSYFAPLCARKLNMPWASVMLSPMTFWSVYDPPVIPTMEFLKYGYRFGPDFNRFLFREIFRVSNKWTEPVQQLRKKESIQDQSNPLTTGATSDFLNIGMYSRLLGEVQPDFPPNSVLTDFVFFDQHLDHQDLSPRLQNFLLNGAPPIVFTLGSNSVMKHGQLFDLFYEVARKLPARSVILTGKTNFAKYKSISSDKIFFDDYASYSRLFPHASCIVHQGGIGTTGQAMNSGKPMLILPECNDQHDNLERTKRLGIAKGIMLKRITINNLKREIQSLLADPGYIYKAAQVAQAMRTENGVLSAADVIENVLYTNSTSDASRSSSVLN